MELKLYKEVFKFISELTITQGVHQAKPFKLLDWQKKFVFNACKPGVVTAALTMGRGGGKTTLCAALALCGLYGPLSQARGEVVLVASSLEQAKLAFNAALAMMQPMLEEEPGRWRVRDNQNMAVIEDKETKAVLRARPSDPKRLLGLQPSLIIADEPAAWERTKVDKSWGALETATGKLGAKILVIGTRPDDSAHFFAKLLAGGADYAQVHAAGPDDPIDDPKTWEKAIPSLPHMPELYKDMETKSRHAMQDTQVLTRFKAYMLNQGVSDVMESFLLDPETWMRCEGTAERKGRVVWGIDAGGEVAMTAMAAYWPYTGRLECFAMFPSDPPLDERGRNDAVGDLYLRMARNEELLVSGGKTVHIPDLLAEALQRFGPPDLVVADRYHKGILLDSFKASNVPPVTIEFRGNGWNMDGTEDVYGFQRACLEGKVKAEPSMLLRNALAEARVLYNTVGNPKLGTGSQGGRRSAAKDDAASASVLAVAAGQRKIRQEAAKPSSRPRMVLI